MHHVCPLSQGLKKTIPYAIIGPRQAPVGRWAVAKPLTYIALSAAFVGSVAAEVVHPDVFSVLERDADCRSLCTARHGDDPPFTLSFDYYEGEYDTHINLRIGGREFKGLPLSRGSIKDGYLPFDKYRFPRHTLYGLVAFTAIRNMDVHYFIRLEDGFRYLGEFPDLSYDTDTGLFVGWFLHDRLNASRFNYVLQDDRLVEVEN